MINIVIITTCAPIKLVFYCSKLNFCLLFIHNSAAQYQYAIGFDVFVSSVRIFNWAAMSPSANPQVDVMTIEQKKNIICFLMTC